MEPDNRVVILSCVLFATLSFIISPASAQKQVEQDILKKILADPYDKRIRPLGRGENASDPVFVTVNLFVRNIEWIDDTKMEYSVQLTFRQQWNDWRLGFYKYNPPSDLNYLTVTNVDQVWTPDTFFTNEKNSHRHDLMVPNNYIRIFPNGDILYSSRISLTLSCPMNLRRYPFDDQFCAIRLASYGYTNKDIHFLWKNETPVQVTTDLSMPKFSFGELETSLCDSITNTGTYSCLRVDFKFHREFKYFLLHVYIPSTTFITISWLSFWLDRRAVAARSLLGIAPLLVMAMEVASFNRLLPPVSYTKAIDWWTGICLTFIFGSLIEFIVVNYLSRSEEQAESSQQGNNKEEEIPINHVTTDSEHGGPQGDGKPTESTAGNNSGINKLAKKYWTGFKSKSEKIDGASRILFPLAFFLFVILYSWKYV